MGQRADFIRRFSKALRKGTKLEKVNHLYHAPTALRAWHMNGVQESIESVTGNPSMTAFRRSNMDAEHEITYQFSYD
jgi:hypothetical protein